MFGLNLPAKAFFLIIGLALVFFIGGCAVQEPVEEEPPEEEPVENEVEPEENAEDFSDQGYFSKERPQYRTEMPLVSPDQNYLLGTFEGQLKLYEYPEKEMLNSYDFDQEYTLQFFAWHPQGEEFIVFVESDQQFHIDLVDLEGEKKRIKSFDQAAHDTNVISLEGLDARVDFLDWALEGEALALDVHGEEYSSLKLIDLDGQTHLEEDWDDRSFLRRPLADPEKRQLAFTRYGSTGENLWIWDFNDEEIRQVTEGSIGDYPFYWLNQRNLMVILGAIGTGGGHHYGLAKINLETGEREWTYSLEEEGKIYMANSLSPDHNLVLGVERNMAGTDARASILDLETKEQVYFLNDYSISRSEWISDHKVIFSASGWEKKEDRYSGREDHFAIKQYSLKNGLITLVEDDEELYLLGVAGDEVHYLKTAADDSFWVWQTKELELE